MALQGHQRPADGLAPAEYRQRRLDMTLDRVVGTGLAIDQGTQESYLADRADDLGIVGLLSLAANR